MFFALMLGVGIALAPREQVAPLVAVLEALYAVVMRIIDLAMRLAPYGVACLLFTLTARFGVTVLRQLGAYVAVVLAGLAFHQFVTYSVILRTLGGMSPALFFRRMREVLVTSFSTSSSAATLPLALRTAKQKLGVPPEIANFVLTLGSTANQNGTALFEGVTVLFLAQFYGVHLGLEQQLLVVLMSILAGVGTAGVPGGSLPLLVPVLVTVGVPAEGIGIIVGVDRLLDMCRTVLNVTGDMAAAVVVARSEGVLDVPQHVPEPVEAPA
jgi:DAACS family dicarboxylate/amino acid:cation (Na+ or H+) symporter